MGDVPCCAAKCDERKAKRHRSENIMTQNPLSRETLFVHFQPRNCRSERKRQRQGLPAARGRLFMAVVPVDEAEAATVSCDGVCKSEEGRSSGGVTWWNDVLPQLLSQHHLRANAAPKIAKLGPGDTPRSPAYLCREDTIHETGAYPVCRGGLRRLGRGAHS